MSDKKNDFIADIIYPTGCNDASPDAVALCEGFIMRLIFSKKEKLNIKINTLLMLVECNDPEIKKYLDLILKSQKINEFYIQFKNFLHPIEGSMNNGLLVCRINNKKITFCIDEKIGLPNFCWEIFRFIEVK